jgi:hypothetical protein
LGGDGGGGGGTPVSAQRSISNSTMRPVEMKLASVLLLHMLPKQQGSASAASEHRTPIGVHGGGGKGEGGLSRGTGGGWGGAGGGGGCGMGGGGERMPAYGAVGSTVVPTDPEKVRGTEPSSESSVFDDASMRSSAARKTPSTAARLHPSLPVHEGDGTASAPFSSPLLLFATSTTYGTGRAGRAAGAVGAVGAVGTAGTAGTAGTKTVLGITLDVFGGNEGSSSRSRCQPLKVSPSIGPLFVRGCNGR